MIGGDAIGRHAVGEMITDVPRIYNPVSKIITGGQYNSRPSQVAELGVTLAYDEGSDIVYDDQSLIRWGT